MATIKTGAVVAEIRGSLGGNVFSRNKGGAYVRQRVKPINPNSPAQAAVRGVFGTLQAAWRGLTQAERDSWAEATKAYTAVNRVGDVIQYTPLQLFTRCNMTLLEGGEAQINTIPPAPGSDVIIALQKGPHPWEVLSTNVDEGAVIRLDIPGSAPAASRIRLYASAPVSAGIASERSVRMKLIGHYAPEDVTIVDGVGTVVVGPDYNAAYPVTDAAIGDKVFLRADFYRANRGFAKPIGVQQINLVAPTP